MQIAVADPPRERGTPGNWMALVDIAVAWGRVANTSAVHAVGVIDASTLTQDFHATREAPLGPGA